MHDGAALTGDGDTVASMAPGCATGSRAYQQDLAAVLYEQRDNTPFGRDHPAHLDRRLRAPIPG